MIYLSLFLAVFIEGPVATLAFAALAGMDSSLNPLLIGATAVLGNLCADLGWYFLGRSGKGLVPGRWWARLTGAGQAEGVLLHVRNRSLRYFIAAKLGMGVATIPVLVAFGLGRVSLRRLLPTALVCELVWTGGLVALGYLGLGSLHRVTGMADGAAPAWAGLTLVLLCILGLQLEREHRRVRGE